MRKSRPRLCKERAGRQKGEKMALFIEKEMDYSFDFDYEKVADQVVSKVLKCESFPFACEVNLVLTGEEEIRQVNKDYRQIDRVTDVLSFPMLSYDKPADFDFLIKNPRLYQNPENEEVSLGDIMLCLPRMEEQAAEYGHSVLREYAFLLTHSMLHLLGYDHMTQDEAAQMEARQKVILEELDIKR